MTTVSIILGLIVALSMIAMGFAIHELAERVAQLERRER